MKDRLLSPVVPQRLRVTPMGATGFLPLQTELSLGTDSQSSRENSWAENLTEYHEVRHCQQESELS